MGQKSEEIGIVMFFFGVTHIYYGQFVGLHAVLFGVLLAVLPLLVFVYNITKNKPEVHT